MSEVTAASQTQICSFITSILSVFSDNLVSLFSPPYNINMISVCVYVLHRSAVATVIIYKLIWSQQDFLFFFPFRGATRYEERNEQKSISLIMLCRNTTCVFFVLQPIHPHILTTCLCAERFLFMGRVSAHTFTLFVAKVYFNSSYRLLCVNI